MNTYELTIVLPGKATAAKKKAIGEKVEKLVKTFKGKIEKIEDWGVKDFGYLMKKEKSGTFVYHEIKLAPDMVKAVGDKIRLDKEIVRYLLVKKE